MNVIPPLEEGRTWKAPSPADILLTDTHACMPESAFESLLEYSSSIPTGVYPGKMWKAHMDGKWYLRWFGIVPDQPEVCSNNQREIPVMDWKVFMDVATKD